MPDPRKRKENNLFSQEERKILLEVIFIILILAYIGCLVADMLIPNYEPPVALHGIIVGIIGFLIYKRWQNGR